MTEVVGPFSHRGTKLAIVSGYLTLLDAQNRTEIYSRTCPDKNVLFASVAFSPNDLQLVTGTFQNGNAIWLWDTESGQGMPMRVPDAGHTVTATFSPNGKTIAATAGNRVVFFERAGPKASK